MPDVSLIDLHHTAVKRSRGRPAKTPKKLSSSNEKVVPSVTRPRGQKVEPSLEEHQDPKISNADEATTRADLMHIDVLQSPTPLPSTPKVLPFDSVLDLECIISPSAIFTGLYTIPPICIEEREMCLSLPGEIISDVHHLVSLECEGLLSDI